MAAVAAVNLGTSIVPLAFEQLVDLSDSVVRGTVVEKHCAWRTSGDDRFIVTLVRLRVDETILGPAQDSMELQFLGGQLDGKSLEVSGQPRFEVGDEDILFLKGNGRSICPLVGMNYGRVLVVRDAAGRSRVARASGAPLTAVAEMNHPMAEVPAAMNRSLAWDQRAMTVETFSAAVRARAQTEPDVR